ncbi:MAG: CDP-2,3-bis-(O-geranylgeranyl)-sn-glycerol synthase [Thermoplasmata archaeon]|nr:CDP-2,3-bis-(O-geranylgeranyl)-sn-glycerol synthase [Thermoplasmata archaeon]
MLVEIILQAIWFMFPAYVANPSAVLFGGGTPMDFGRSMSDGKRVFGNGKTWRGFIGGVFIGVLVGAAQIAGASVSEIEELSFGAFPNSIFIVFLMAFGSMVGDLLGSFIKRRTGAKRGAKRPIIDMYTFLFCTFVFLLVFQWNWTTAHYFYGESIAGFVTVLIATPLLHRGVNIIGYKMGKKDVPW